MDLGRRSDCSQIRFMINFRAQSRLVTIVNFTRLLLLRHFGLALPTGEFYVTSSVCPLSLFCNQGWVPWAIPWSFIPFVIIVSIFKIIMSGKRKDERHVQSTIAKEKKVERKKIFKCRRDSCSALLSIASNRSKHEKRSCRSTTELPPPLKVIHQCDRCRMTFSRGYTLRRHELYSCHQVENKTTAENRGHPEVPRVQNPGGNTWSPLTSNFFIQKCFMRMSLWTPESGASRFHLFTRLYNLSLWGHMEHSTAKWIKLNT